MTDNERTSWYWGSLRSACAALNWPRAWQLLAAWPHPAGGPEEDPQSYLVREALRADRLNEALDWRWCLEHYRAQPVPLPDPLPPYADLARDRYGPLSRGVTITKGDTSLGEARDKAPSLDVRGSRGAGASMVLRFRKPARTGRVGGCLLFEWMPHPAGGSSPRLTFPGFRMADQSCFAATAEVALGTADFLVRAGEAARNMIRLLERVRRGEAAEVRCDLLWCDDILERLLEEGPAAHPDLCYSPYAMPSHLNPGLREALLADLPVLNKMLGEGFWDGTGHAWPEP